ncbi:protein of unknown function (plasmid) [Methylocella tundrae]|uniref:Uncharacterized protein n=1 Tax=Methylocella tundrae TaxID=227605 RepID=A0A4V6INA3_METTU|nr:protein of unknown function [Methylocella tundrae]
MTRPKLSEPQAVSAGSLLPYSTDCTEIEAEPHYVQRNNNAQTGGCPRLIFIRNTTLARRWANAPDEDLRHGGSTGSC